MLLWFLFTVFRLVGVFVVLIFCFVFLFSAFSLFFYFLLFSFVFGRVCLFVWKGRWCLDALMVYLHCVSFGSSISSYFVSFSCLSFLLFLRPSFPVFFVFICVEGKVVFRCSYVFSSVCFVWFEYLFFLFVCFLFSALICVFLFGFLLCSCFLCVFNWLQSYTFIEFLFLCVCILVLCFLSLCFC